YVCTALRTGRCRLYASRPGTGCRAPCAPGSLHQGNSPMSAPTSTEPLLRVQNLTVHFPIGAKRHGQVVRAVDDVSFNVRSKTIVGLVGESGSGKTTTGRALLRLFAPTAGRIVFDGTDITALNES